MRLPDPFTHPGLVPGFESVSLTDNDSIMSDRMPDNTVLETRAAGQYWGISIPMPEMFPSEYYIIDAFLCEYKRQGGFVEILLPQYESFDVQGNLSAATIASGQKGSVVKMKIPNLRSKPQVGSLFKFNNHYKVYKITGSTVSGEDLTITVYPELFIETTGAEKPVFNGILFQTKLVGGESVKSVINSDGMYEAFTLNFEESK